MFFFPLLRFNPQPEYYLLSGLWCQTRSFTAGLSTNLQGTAACSPAVLRGSVVPRGSIPWWGSIPWRRGSKASVAPVRRAGAPVTSSPAAAAGLLLLVLQLHLTEPQGPRFVAQPLETTVRCVPAATNTGVRVTGEHEQFSCKTSLGKSVFFIVLWACCASPCGGALQTRYAKFILS